MQSNVSPAPAERAQGSSPAPSPASLRPPRIGVVDAVRGLACVFMIAWHCADAWVSPELREGPGFVLARVAGGFAAPFFLWLAGLSLALSTELRPTWSRTTAGLVRAGWVVAVGYALKLWSWAVDRGAVLETPNQRTLALAIPAMAAVIFAFREPALGSPRARTIAGVVGTSGLLWAYSHLEVATCTPTVLARLDVLHGIGAALATMGLLLYAVGRVATTERARAGILLALAIGVALATPHWIGVPAGPIPPRLVDYVARTTTDFSASGARFPLFPWLGHALYGAVVGTLLRTAPRTLSIDALPLVKRPLLLLALALAVVFVVYEGGWIGPVITARAEWLRSVLRLVFYGTSAIAAAAMLSYLGRLARPLYDGISTMGRSSLLVYGAHLELAYGLLGLPVQGTLGWGSWAAGVLAVMLAMVGLARLAETLERRARSSP